MDYDLARLGPREFEHLTQALCVAALGEKVQIYGDGADGGRDAAVQGRIHWNPEIDEGATETWHGYTVVQAKFRQRPADPAANLKWLLGEVRREMTTWANNRRGHPLPDYLLIATNVTLSPTAGGGIDRAHDEISAALRSFGINLRGWRIWHYDTFRALLDAHRDVRVRYGGFLTSGDVLARLHLWLDRKNDKLGELLTAHTIKDMMAQQYVRLGKAGDNSDDKLALDSIGIDLPAVAGGHSIRGRVGREVMAAEYILLQGNRVVDFTEDSSHILVFGGPGQGKSTLTQMVCQAYRVALLKDAVLGPEPRRLRSRLAAHFDDLGLPTPRNLRWPIRVVLSDYGDQLAANPSLSLMRYIMQRVLTAASFDVFKVGLNDWLGAWPWLIVLDGMDEVVSPTIRERASAGVRDFLIEAGVVKADVLVVITTRPQGYLGEFRSADYRTVQLSDLEPDEALSYARKLTALRLGDDPDLEQQVNHRLAESTKESETSRLMRTPLQVTIMTLLLERRQRVPANRYQLFHAYFDTIYARELNKPTTLGRFLEDYRSDVEAIHESVALELQRQAERVVEHEGALPSADVRRHAFERLRSEGNDEEQALKLAKLVEVAAVHRLVMLVPYGDNGVGFEIRSLREYLAARALTRGEGAQVLAHLRPLVPSAHWRNTWLLAAGRLFTDREGLREQVISLLREFDNRDLMSWLIRAGAELATELLGDDLAIKSPQYRRLLADHALDRLVGLPDGSLPYLASVLSGLAAEDPLVRQKTKERLAGLLTGEGGSRAYALLVLAHISQLPSVLGEWASRLLRDADVEGDPGLAFFNGANPAALPEVSETGLTLPNYLVEGLPELATAERDAALRLFAALPVDRLHLAQAKGLRPAELLLARTGATTDYSLLEETFGRPAVAEAFAMMVTNSPPEHWQIAAYLRDIARTWSARRVTGPPAHDRST
uniref:hypothetical protein n=1 Tax=Herbidospora sakaeratensis TaxID=564415 RepID=UPI000A65E513|nr:hypothetical protein [Herbidospora sakaeratensis]